MFTYLHIGKDFQTFKHKKRRDETEGSGDFLDVDLFNQLLEIIINSLLNKRVFIHEIMIYCDCDEYIHW